MLSPSCRLGCYRETVYRGSKEIRCIGARRVKQRPQKNPTPRWCPDSEPSHLRRISGTLLFRFRNGEQTLVEGTSDFNHSGGGTGPGTCERSGETGASRTPAAQSGRYAAFGQCASRGFAGKPQDRSQLARRTGKTLRSGSHIPIRGATIRAVKRSRNSTISTGRS